MSLSILTLEEDPEVDISFVPQVNDRVEPDPELPDFLLNDDEINILNEQAIALESISDSIGQSGMSSTLARAIEIIEPNFIHKHGGLRTFTASPSLEGLSEAVETIKDKMGAILKRLRQFVSQMYKSFVAWLTAKFSKPTNQDLEQEVQSFLNERRNRDAISFISDLPDDVTQAANDIAIMTTGDTTAFKTAFSDQVQSALKHAANIEQTIIDNPTHFYLATGQVSVKELYGQDESNAMLKKAVEIAFRAMKTNDPNAFMKVIEDVTSVTAELEAFESNMVVKDSAETNERQVDTKLAKLYDNIHKVADEMKRVDVKHMVEDMTATVNHVIQLSDETKIEDILEMIPEGVAVESQNAYAQQIAKLYRSIAKLGQKILKLWKVRANSIESLNKVGGDLLSLVNSFEKAIVNSSSSLDEEQKTTLAKALAGKGLKIIY